MRGQQGKGMLLCHLRLTTFSEQTPGHPGHGLALSFSSFFLLITGQSGMTEVPFRSPRISWVFLIYKKIIHVQLVTLEITQFSSGCLLTGLFSVPLVAALYRAQNESGGGTVRSEIHRKGTLSRVDK